MRRLLGATPIAATAVSSAFVLASDPSLAAAEADRAATAAAAANTSHGTTAHQTAAFDAGAAWEQSAKIGLRPEPFGALAYHFDTRRLVFLKSPKLVELVSGLAEYESADAAIASIIEPDTERSRHAHVTALASLAEAGVIEPRSATKGDAPRADAAQSGVAPASAPSSKTASSPPISFVG